MDSAYREIIKFSLMLDKEWDNLIHRKDDIDLGDYVIIIKCGDCDGGTYQSLVIQKKNYASMNTDIMTLRSHKGVKNYHPNYFRYNDHIFLNSHYNKCYVMDVYNDIFFDGIIPYDITATADERKMSVNFAIDSEYLRNMMYHVIDFQSLNLNHIDVINYNYHSGIDIGGRSLYNYFTSRPLFRRYRTIK